MGHLCLAKASLEYISHKNEKQYNLGKEENEKKKTISILIFIYFSLYKPSFKNFCILKNTKVVTNSSLHLRLKASL
jgi:hypothetical protein